MPTQVVVTYGKPATFWLAALVAHLLSIAWLALDIRAGHEWSARPLLLLAFGVAFFATPLMAAFAVANAPRVVHSDWRGVLGLLAFVVIAFLDLTVLGNLYFLMGGLM